MRRFAALWCPHARGADGCKPSVRRPAIAGSRGVGREAGGQTAGRLVPLMVAHTITGARVFQVLWVKVRSGHCWNYSGGLSSQIYPERSAPQNSEPAATRDADAFSCRVAAYDGADCTTSSPVYPAIALKSRLRRQTGLPDVGTAAR